MSHPTLSIATDLELIRRAYRQALYAAGSRLAAEQTALEAYCSLHPEVSKANAREAVAMLIKASSEAGLICWTDN